jgi:hypothetical protein
MLIDLGTRGSKIKPEPAPELLLIACGLALGVQNQTHAQLVQNLWTPEPAGVIAILSCPQQIN